VVALFGFASATLSLDAMPIVKEKRVPFFAPFTGADAIHKQDPIVFVMRASYADELVKILEHWGAARAPTRDRGPLRRRDRQPELRHRRAHHEGREQEGGRA
jgi:hypothetical protein